MASAAQQEELAKLEVRKAALSKARDQADTSFLTLDKLFEHADIIAALVAFALVLAIALLWFSKGDGATKMVKKMKRPRWAPRQGIAYFVLFLLRIIFNVTSVAMIVMKENRLDLTFGITFGCNAAFSLLYTLSIVYLGDASLGMLMALLGFGTTVWESVMLSDRSDIASTVCFGTLIINLYMLFVVGRMWYATEIKQAMSMMNDMGIKVPEAASKSLLDGAANGGGGGRRKGPKIPPKAVIEAAKRM